MDNTQILYEIGSRIKQARIRQQLTQSELAGSAGVTKSTIERAEKGDSVQFITIIKILRHLEYLGNLESLLPDSSLTPIEVLHQKNQKKRQRVRKKNTPAIDTGWMWGDE